MKTTAIAVLGLLLVGACIHIALLTSTVRGYQQRIGRMQEEVNRLQAHENELQATVNAITSARHLRKVEP